MEYTSTVVRFEKGLTNTGRLPYAYPVLACGHAAALVLKPRQMVCCGCGSESLISDLGLSQPCECGTWHRRQVWAPDHHNEADYITQIGDVVPCETCEREAKQIEWLRGLDKSTVLLSRFRHGSYYFYRHDPASPSGKMLIGGVMASPKIEAVLNELRYSPLSPTEMIGA